MDIEPYISDSWKENPEEYMDRYISCMKKGYKFAQKNHLRTAICIPRHYDNQGLTSGLEELIRKGVTLHIGVSGGWKAWSYRK